MPSPEELFPIDAAERPLRFPSAAPDPVAIVREEWKRLEETGRAERDSLLVAHANTWFHLGRVRDELKSDHDAPTVLDALAIIADNLHDLLEQQHVRVEDFAGKPWDDVARAAADLRGSFIREDITQSRVAHTEAPAVYHRDRLLQRGAVLIESPRRGK